MNEIPAIFVSYGPFLATAGGGVQLCTREYRFALERAGFALDILCFELGKSLRERLRRRIFPEVSLLSSSPLTFETLRRRVADTRAQFVFFNHTPFPALSGQLARECPQVGQVLLSHGVDGIDFLIAQSAHRQSGRENLRRSVADRMLGQTLFAEAELRVILQAVLTLSPFEVQIEKWLGTRNVLWVPRTILEAELPWQPHDGRVGCVSTLDHPPNLRGLEDLFDAIGSLLGADFEFRLVGQPTREGHRLAARYSFVRYLGPLDDAELRAEASTWCCFVHPIFILAKGCSTKLAAPLGWGIPIATTEVGARGYLWDPSSLPLARSPSELANLLIERSTLAHGEIFKKQTQDIAALAPSMSQVAQQIRTFLLDETMACGR
jgi:hypothetical protein